MRDFGTTSKLDPRLLAQIVEELRALLETHPVEERLLAAAVQTHLRSAAKDSLVALLDQRPDWGVVASEAEAHRIAPLLFATLSRSPFLPLVPGEILERLRARYLANGVSNLLWQHELRGILAKLQCAAVPAVLLKGSAPLLTVYSDPALREMRDLDLLVRPGDLNAAEQCLLSAGYVPAEEQWPVGTWPQEWYEKKFRKQKGGASAPIVEIHWGLARSGAPFNIGIELLLRDSEAICMEGMEARVLSPSHQILHLCTHMAFNDGFGVGMSRPADLHETIERFRDRLDWDELVVVARRFRASRCLRYSLAVTTALFGTKLPTALLEGAGDPRLEPSLAAAALERVLANHHDPTPLPATLAKLISTDRPDLKAALNLLLPRPRHLRDAYRLLQPSRLINALRYARSVR